MAALVPVSHDVRIMRERLDATREITQTLIADHELCLVLFSTSNPFEFRAMEGCY